jgi:hypothetical protein
MISELSFREALALQSKIKGIENKHNSLEDAAQHYMSILYDELKESIVLARLFATIPFKDLPKSNKEFVMTLANSSGILKMIEDDTLVLSLMGSRGTKPEWNDRRKSKGHIGLPLTSSDFIDKIPMLSRLLKQLGAEIDWVDKSDTGLVIDTFKSISGVFYVKDAKTEIDHKGRKIIAAQDFVEEEKVKTVFGVGGKYLKTSLFFTTIIFLRESIEEKITDNFTLQASKFKIATTGLIHEGKMFNNEA